MIHYSVLRMRAIPILHITNMPYLFTASQPSFSSLIRMTRKPQVFQAWGFLVMKNKRSHIYLKVPSSIHQANDNIEALEVLNLFLDNDLQMILRLAA